MLHFEDVSKSFYVKGRMRPIIAHASFTATMEDNYGLVVPQRAGRTTITNLILGAEQPDTGKIYRYGKISWPVGGVQGLINPLSGAENCRYIAMIYGLEPEDVLAFVIDLARIGRYMDMPVRTYSSTLRQRLSMALLLALDFDMYLVIEGAGAGDREFSRRAKPILADKLEHTPVMFMASNVGRMKNFCERVAVLHDTRLYEFGSLDAAARFQDAEVLAHG